MHVNDGRVAEITIEHTRTKGKRTSIYTSSFIEVGENCALCTAAGIVNAGAAFKMTSGDVAREMQLFRPHDAPRFQTKNTIVNWMKSNSAMHGGHLVDGQTYASMHELDQAVLCQAEGIAYYCRRKMGFCKTALLGGVDGHTYPQAAGWMLKQQGGVLFAVWFCVAFHECSGAHWLMARRNGDALEFVDYQTDTPDGAPTVSSKPVIGVLKSDYSDKDLTSVNTIVVCFWPRVRGELTMIA